MENDDVNLWHRTHTHNLVKIDVENLLRLWEWSTLGNELGGVRLSHSLAPMHDRMWSLGLPY